MPRQLLVRAASPRRRVARRRHYWDGAEAQRAGRWGASSDRRRPMRGQVALRCPCRAMYTAAHRRGRSGPRAARACLLRAGRGKAIHGRSGNERRIDRTTWVVWAQRALDAGSTSRGRPTGYAARIGDRCTSVVWHRAQVHVQTAPSRGDRHSPRTRPTRVPDSERAITPMLARLR